MNAAMTPGDPVDKGIAFGTDFALSGLGGLGAGRLARRAGASEGMQIGMDQLGSVAGAFGSMPATDALLRAKGGGTTPYEKLAMEQQMLMEEQIRQQLLREMGYSPDSGTDPFMYDLGLAS